MKQQSLIVNGVKVHDIDEAVSILEDLRDHSDVIQTTMVSINKFGYQRTVRVAFLAKAPKVGTRWNKEVYTDLKKALIKVLKLEGWGVLDIPRS